MHVLKILPSGTQDFIQQALRRRCSRKLIARLYFLYFKYKVLKINSTQAQCHMSLESTRQATELKPALINMLLLLTDGSINGV